MEVARQQTLVDQSDAPTIDSILEKSVALTNEVQVKQESVADRISDIELALEPVPEHKVLNESSNVKETIVNAVSSAVENVVDGVKNVIDSLKSSEIEGQGVKSEEISVGVESLKLNEAAGAQEKQNLTASTDSTLTESAVKSNTDSADTIPTEPAVTSTVEPPVASEPAKSASLETPVTTEPATTGNVEPTTDPTAAVTETPAATKETNASTVNSETNQVQDVKPTESNLTIADSDKQEKDQETLKHGDNPSEAVSGQCDKKSNPEPPNRSISAPAPNSTVNSDVHVSASAPVSPPNGQSTTPISPETTQVGSLPKETTNEETKPEEPAGLIKTIESAANDVTATVKDEIVKPIDENITKATEEVTKASDKVVETVTPVVENVTKEVSEKIIETVVPVVEETQKEITQLTENLEKNLQVADEKAQEIVDKVAELPTTIVEDSQTIVSQAVESVKSELTRTEEVAPPLPSTPPPPPAEKVAEEMVKPVEEIINEVSSKIEEVTDLPPPPVEALNIDKQQEETGAGESLADMPNDLDEEVAKSVEPVVEASTPAEASSPADSTPADTSETPAPSE